MFSFDSSAAAWIALAIVAGIIEITLPQFGVIFVSLAALVSAGVATFGANLVMQVLAFIITLALSLMLLRPRLVSQLDSKGVPHRTATLIGREGIVTTTSTPLSAPAASTSAAKTGPRAPPRACQPAHACA